MKAWNILAASCALALAGPLPAAAVTLDLAPDGTLLGASGIPILGKTYSVAFGDGTCQTLFSTCADAPLASGPPAFAFTTLEAAVAASQALSDLVLIDGPGAPEDDYDNRPEFTQGCPAVVLCGIVTPYAYDAASGLVSLSSFVNWREPDPDGSDTVFPNALAPTPITYSRTFDTSEFQAITYAVWTEVPAIPLPAGAPLVLTGLAALAALGVQRRRTRAAG